MKRAGELHMQIPGTRPTVRSSISDMNSSHSSSAAQRLDSELSGWLDAVKPEAGSSYAPPIKRSKAIIAPCAAFPRLCFWTSCVK